MRSSVPYLPLLGVFAGAATVSNSSTWSQCEAHMDGHLPYYVPEGFNFSGNVRRYYMASELVTWDYAPSGWDNWLGVPLNQSFRAQTSGYIPSNMSLGTRFDKALYRGYTDASFTKKSNQPAWQGYQGPLLRAEVGDMIEILFVNKLPEFYSSVHSMGLFYTKESEGSIYYNGTSSSVVGNAVPPGGSFVYKWLVPPSSAPDPGTDSKLFTYHSYVSMYSDQDAGLSGPMIIYNQGQMNRTMAQNREFVIFYGDNQESNSWLALHNIQKYLPAMASKNANQSSQYPQISAVGNETIWYPQLINTPLTNVSTSIAANFFPMNGYIFANNPPFEMCLNDKAIWYIWNMGFDTHVTHWHGNNVVRNGLVTSTVPNNPGQSITTFMNASNPGWWQLICHFNTHLSKGMEANYIIYGPGQCPLLPLQQ